MDGASSRIKQLLDDISEELRNRATSLVSNLIQDFPIQDLRNSESIQDSIEDGIVYEIAFEGNDSDAELLEKKTGLTLLGECDDEFPEERNCLITGKATKRMQHIARMY